MLMRFQLSLTKVKNLFILFMLRVGQYFRDLCMVPILMKLKGWNQLWGPVGPRPS